MKQFVKSAEYQRYNANSRGNNSEDCVKRSLSLALDIPYSEIEKILNDALKKTRAPGWNYHSVYFPILKKYGCSDWMTDGLDIELDSYGRKLHQTSLNEFVDNIADPNKIYLVITGSRKLNSNHIVCVRDGKVWDSWDSRDQWVFQYCIAPDSEHKLGDNKVSLGPLGYDHAEPLVIAQMKKYITRKKWDCSYYEAGTTKATNYNLKIKAKVVLEPTDWVDKKRSYTFEISYTIEPTMSEQQAIELVEKITPTRVYDRMYAIDQQEKQLKEAEDMKREMAKQAENGPFAAVDAVDPAYMDNREYKFYKSLPGWVKPLITYLHIYEPGQFSDSYEMSIRKLPNDDKHPDLRRIDFRAYESYAIKDMLRRYKENLEVPGDDYDEYNDY